MSKIVKKKSLFIILAILMVSLLALSACGGKTDDKVDADAPANKLIILATTTSTEDSGLLNELLPAFTAKTDYEVDVLSMGTGKAVATGETGDCDVILVHARELEDEFVASGYGVNRKDVMYNDFIIVGPEEDPAGIKGMSVEDALIAISENEIVFVSRGDQSGTHVKELFVWDNAGIVPEGDWYQSVNKGMGDTLNMANEQLGYTMADRGTFISMEDNLELVILVEGEEVLFNPYGIIAVNPELHPEVNFDGATALTEFVTSDEGRAIIEGFTLKGKQLFYCY